MKTTQLIILSIVISSMVAFNSCNESLHKENEVFEMADKSAMSDYQNSDSCTYDGVLSDSEIEGLKFMVEEEKMAHDVYVTLYQLYDYNLFNNISKSENSHTNAVLSLIDGYGVDFQISTMTGQFSNSDIQTLYDALIEKGKISLEEALATGALIEETDINDLVKQLEVVLNEDVKHVYSNLLKGSENHLRAFVGSLSRLGVEYSAEILSQDSFEAILESANSNGQGNNQGSNGSGAGQGNQGNSNGNGQGNRGGNANSSNGDGIVCDSTSTPANNGGNNGRGNRGN